MAAPAALCLSAKAQVANTGSNDTFMTGATQRMFIINAVTPGALTFSGAGTATFNNSVGTSNQFNVGSNTSIGVNASVSATPEFDGVALGMMSLAQGSNLMQTNGTSSAAASTQAAASAANTVATETARRQSHEAGWEAAQTATGVASTQSGNYGSYDSSGSWQWNDSYFGRSATEAGYSNDASGQAAWKAEQTAYSQFKNAYTTTYNASYNDNYATAYSNVLTNSSSSADSSSASGIIKGNFKSVEDSISSVGQQNAMNSVASAATTAANATGTTAGSATWNAAFTAAFNAGYQNAVGTVKSTSTSDVSIEGLGAIASVNADKASTFNVNLERLTEYKTAGSQENSTATANGSATSTLSTNSFATQNNQRTASAFMQAFAAAPTPTNVDLETGTIYASQNLGRIGGDGTVSPLGATPSTAWVAPQ